MFPFDSVFMKLHRNPEEPPLPCLTASVGGVDQKQQDVVEKALEQRGVGVVIIRQVFAGQANPTDEQW